MSILNIISLGGGVALFLYGMTIMGNGLEKLSGGKMEKMLEKMAGNVFSGILLGAVTTAIIQSSSATTVIVIGLINAGMLKLRQGIGIIMGANIGTTITAQLIRLSDIQSDGFLLLFFKPKNLAPLAALIGILLFMISSKARRRELGQILIGFGILFSGMFSMESAVSPLKDSPMFAEILLTMSNPVLGVVAGALITAILQSSSASIGILQALASTGAIRFSAAFPIIMGQNIGTCITAIISSVGASKNAKRAAAVHLSFNVIGTAAFMVIAYSLKAFIGAPAFWEDAVTRTTIANFHTIFNLVVTILFIPFTGFLEKLACTLVKDDGESQREKILDILEERLLISPGLALSQSERMLNTMAEYSQQSYYDTLSLVARYDPKTIERINSTENLLDKMEDKLTNYLVALSQNPTSDSESRLISSHLRLAKEYERIGDYCTNIMESAIEISQNSVTFSEQATGELDVLLQAVGEIMQISNEAFAENNIQKANLIEPLEETIDEIVSLLRDGHIERLKKGLCSIHSGIVFLELLTNLERIADHCSNIGCDIISRSYESDYEAHEYLHNMHNDPNQSYSENYDRFMRKYFDPAKSFGI